jgi:hypothetical protein
VSGELRPISPEEVEVIRATFAQGQPIRNVSPTALESLPSLSVVAGCPCGCASVDFVEFAQAGPHPSLLADAVATNTDGSKVGLMVWGHPDAITALEVYSVDGADGNKHLPDPASIRSYFPTE